MACKTQARVLQAICFVWQGRRIFDRSILAAACGHHDN